LIITLLVEVLIIFNKLLSASGKDEKSSLMSCGLTEDDLDDIVQEIHLRIKERLKQQDSNGNQFHDFEAATKL